MHLPISLDWGPNPVYDLSKDAEIRTFYERVLNESLSVAQLETFLNKEILVDLWPRLWPDREVRKLWEDRFPELAPQSWSPQSRCRQCAWTRFLRNARVWLFRVWPPIGVGRRN